jgi:ATP-dependent DNA ligase
MLAKLQEQIPEGSGWRYEPKWDGIRTLVFREPGETLLISREDRPLGRYFPEALAVLDAMPTERFVADGELVIVRPDGLAFDELLQRIHPAASRVRMLAEQWPVTLVLFDLLARGDRDLRRFPVLERRRELEALVRDLGGNAQARTVRDLRPGPEIVLTPQTADLALARAWFADEDGIGQDGIVAKREDLTYREGERAMVKVKHHRTADCVVGGYRLAKSGDGVGSLLLGLFDEERTLHHVGHTSSFKAAERRALLETLRPLEGGVSFEGGRSPGGPSRWTGGRDLSWVALRPERVCEVRFDRMQGERFRHAATFLRWRSDREPRSCPFAQLSGGTSAS